MKVLGNLPIVKKTDSDKPFGFTIQDKTSTQEGTPVNSDVMADLLNNFYRLLELANITPTNNFDGDSTQYQIIDALKKLPNSMNDIEQVLTLTGTVWSVPLDLSILPNKYFFIARASENYDTSETYTFKGIGTDTYSFTSLGFKTGSNIIVVVDTSGVRAYSLHQDLENIVDAGNKTTKQIEFNLPSYQSFILKQVVEGEGSYTFGFAEETLVIGTPANSLKARIESPETNILFKDTGGVEKKVAYEDDITNPDTLIEALNNCDATQILTIKGILGI